MIYNHAHIYGVQIWYPIEVSQVDTKEIVVTNIWLVDHTFGS